MYTLLGDTYEDLKRWDKALEAYGQVPADSPLRSNAEMEMAVSLQRLERKDEALVKLEQLIAREPKNYDAIVTLGNLYRNNEDYANAAGSMTMRSHSSPSRCPATGASTTTMASRMSG